MEYQLATKFYSTTELFEGVRALLIDKDRKPNWQYKSVNDIPAEVVQSYFTQTPEGATEWNINKL